MSRYSWLLTLGFWVIGSASVVGRAAPYVPPALTPGSNYHLVFVTDGTRNGTSTLITDYDTFVQGQAALNPTLTGTNVGVFYKAIGSTTAVHANVNAPITAPVYNFNGDLIANGFTDMWNGTLANPILYDQFATFGFPDLFTGTAFTGLAVAGSELGTANPRTGLANFSSVRWIDDTVTPNNENFAFYGLSQQLTVAGGGAVPEPSSCALITFGFLLLGSVTLRRHRSAAPCVAAILTMFATTAIQAGEITLVTPFPGINSVAGTALFPPSAPGNDDVSGLSPNNIFVTQKDYVVVAPVDLVFDVTDNDGVTEYFVEEGVSNSTGLDWTGYHIELGFGAGAGFVKSSAGDGLDFDAPDENSPVNFNPAPFTYFTTFARPTEDDLIAGGGDLANLEFAGNFEFQIDVPNGITSFTIRQSPIVAPRSQSTPEPTTFALAALGLLWLGFVGWRRRKRA